MALTEKRVVALETARLVDKTGRDSGSATNTAARRQVHFECSSEGSATSPLLDTVGSLSANELESGTAVYPRQDTGGKSEESGGSEEETTTYTSQSTPRTGGGIVGFVSYWTGFGSMSQ